MDEAGILAGHRQTTRQRFDATEGHVLAPRDTVEFSFQRESPTRMGPGRRTVPGQGVRSRMHAASRVRMQAGLVVTTNGLPLGLAAITSLTRRKFNGANRLERTTQATRMPSEAKECVCCIQNLQDSSATLAVQGRLPHLGDRESDMYEFLCAAYVTGSHFLIGACVDRLAKDGTVTIEQVVEDLPIRGLHRIEVPDRDGVRSEANL